MLPDTRYARNLSVLSAELRRPDLRAPVPALQDHRPERLITAPGAAKPFRPRRSKPHAEKTALSRTLQPPEVFSVNPASHRDTPGQGRGATGRAQPSSLPISGRERYGPVTSCRTPPGTSLRPRPSRHPPRHRIAGNASLGPLAGPGGEAARSGGHRPVRFFVRPTMGIFGGFGGGGGFGNAGTLMFGLMGRVPCAGSHLFSRRRRRARPARTTPRRPPRRSASTAAAARWWSARRWRATDRRRGSPPPSRRRWLLRRRSSVNRWHTGGSRGQQSLL